MRRLVNKAVVTWDKFSWQVLEHFSDSHIFLGVKFSETINSNLCQIMMDCKVLSLLLGQLKNSNNEDSNAKLPEVNNMVRALFFVKIV